MRKRPLPFCALVALCVMLLCRTAYALDAPFRLELRTQGAASMERPYETWFFLEDGRAYATTGELCAYAKAPGEGGTEVITLAGGSFGGNAIVVDGEGATATADRSGVACGFDVVDMPTSFRAQLAGSQAGSRIDYTASLAGGVGDAFTYRYHVYDGAGNLVYGDVRAGNGAMSIAPGADGRYEAFVTATDAGGAVSDFARATVVFSSGTATAVGEGSDGIVLKSIDVDDTEQTMPRSDGGAKPEEPVDPVDPVSPDKPVDPVKPDNPVNPDKPVDPVKPDNPDKPVDPVKPDKPGKPEFATPPINKKARASIEGYQLYANPDGTGVQPVTNPNFDGSFNADVYQSILSDPLRGDGEAELTIMLYMCGTDLEGTESAASEDLVNVLETKYDLSRVNVLLLAGGTMSWKNEAMQENNDDVRVCLYYLDPNGIKDVEKSATKLSDKFDSVLTSDTAERKGSLRLLGSYGQASMGEPELLLGFLDTAYDLFPADHYWLSLWNHGGGSAKGICFGDPVSQEKNASAYRGIDISSDPLTLAALEEAFRSSKIVNDHGDLDILSTDACLMAGIELAYNCSPYVRYLIASEETTVNNTPYDDYLSMFRKLDEGGTECMSAGEIAVNAARSFISKGTSEDLEAATMSVCDLKRLDECADAINTFGYAMSSLLKNEKTSQQVAACIEKSAYRTSNFGHSEDGGENYVDLYDLLSRLVPYLTYEQQITTDTEAGALYESALEAVSDLLQVPFVAYRGGLYNNSYMQEDEMTYEDDALTIDMSKSEATGLWSVLGYDNLSGITIYFPRNTSIFNPYEYNEQNILPGYVDMLEQYGKIARSGKRLQEYKDAAQKLSGNFSSIIDDLKVRKCSYIDKDGIEQHGLAFYVSFKDDVDPSVTNGLDPVAAFSNAIDSYDVLVLRDRTTAIAGDGEEYDIVVGRSAEIHSGQGTTGSVTIDEKTGEIHDTSGLAFDLSMMEINGHIVTATEGGDGGAKTEDWGLAHDEEKPLKKKLQKNDPAYADSWKEYFSALDGVVHTADKNGTQTTYDAILIFGAESKEDTYTYKGALVTRPDDKEVSVSEDRWIPADAENSRGITLYHYRLNEKKDGLVRMEDKNTLGDPTFSFENGTFPTMEKVDLVNPDGKDIESQERNRFALEITDITEKKSVLVIDDVSLATSGDGPNLSQDGSAATNRREKAAEQDEDGTGRESERGSAEKDSEASSVAGTAEGTDPAKAKVASSPEATDSTRESASAATTGSSKATDDSTRESGTSKESSPSKADDSTRADDSTKESSSSKAADSSKEPSPSKADESAKESSPSKADESTKEAASPVATDSPKVADSDVDPSGSNELMP